MKYDICDIAEYISWFNVSKRSLQMLTVIFKIWLYIYAQHKNHWKHRWPSNEQYENEVKPVILLDLFIPFPCAYHWHQSTSNMRTWAKKLCFKKITVPFAFWRSVKNLRNVFVNDVKLHSWNKKCKSNERSERHPYRTFQLDI